MKDHIDQLIDLAKKNMEILDILVEVNNGLEKRIATLENRLNRLTKGA